MAALLDEAADEIERLRDAKRRALALADERAKEANSLRSQAAMTNDRIDHVADAIIGALAPLLETFEQGRSAARAAIAADAAWLAATSIANWSGYAETARGRPQSWPLFYCAAPNLPRRRARNLRRAHRAATPAQLDQDVLRRGAADR
jgi:hypothetical protein